MKRFWISGALVGLLSASIGAGHALSQLPPIPNDIPSAPSPTLMTPGEGSVITPPVPMPNSNEVAPTPHFDPPPKITPQFVEPSQPRHSHMAPTPVARHQNPAYHGSTVVPGVNTGATAWQPGGYSARRGNPYYYTTPGRNQPLYSVHNNSGTPWAFDHSSYQYHFGPGYYRHSEGGHYRFPYYTYRAPWYFPGHPIYNRDTNRPW